MLTVTDIKKLTQVFATKDDMKKLRATVDKIVKELVALRYDYHEMNDKMASKAELRQVMTGVDKVYGELIKKRGEQSAHAQRHDDLDEEINQTQKRLNRIEKVHTIAHQIKK